VHLRRLLLLGLLTTCQPPPQPTTKKVVDLTSRPRAADRAVELAVGDNTSCAVMASGKVRCWGNRSYFEPLAAVAELEGMRGLAIAASDWAERICGVRGEGEVVCLALAGIDERRVEATGITDARQVIVAGNGLCALHERGAVTCWAQPYGWRSWNDTQEQSVGPQAIAGVPPFVKLHAGRATCGETAAGDFHCWSFEPNAEKKTVTASVFAAEVLKGARQLSGEMFIDGEGKARRMLGPSAAEAAPWDLPPLRQVRSGRFTCGITEEEQRVVCGSGSEGYLNENNGVLGLGHREAATATTWGTVALPAPAEQVELGTLHACALAGGEVHCWGNNDSNQLGMPRRSASTEPALIPLPARAKQVATHFETTCAVVEGDRVHCWGRPGFEGLTLLPERATAITVSNGNDDQICGHTQDHVWCRSQGELFIDDAVESVVEIAAGWRYLCWRDASDHVACTGYLPVEAESPIPFGHSQVPDLIAKSLFSAGGTVCARTDHGPRCFDAEAGGAPNAVAFTPAHHLDGFDRLFSSPSDLCGVKQGALECFDHAMPGEPQAIRTLPKFFAGSLSTGPFHSCSLSAGKVACWGSGQDGAGGYWGYRKKPTPLDLSFAVDAVAAGRSHTCLLGDGRVYCLGSNEYGQMAVPPTDDVFPAPVTVELP
jgi:hypothetical protein